MSLSKLFHHFRGPVGLRQSAPGIPDFVSFLWKLFFELDALVWVEKTDLFEIGGGGVRVQDGDEIGLYGG